MLIERVDLVSHQRNQRRYYYGASILENGRQLIADRLAAARGQYDELITTVEKVATSFLLIRSEAIVSECPLERLLKRHPLEVSIYF